MLKLEKSLYQNSILQLNYTRYEKKLSYKIIFYVFFYSNFFCTILNFFHS